MYSQNICIADKRRKSESIKIDPKRIIVWVFEQVPNSGWRATRVAERLRAVGNAEIRDIPETKRVTVSQIQSSLNLVYYCVPFAENEHLNTDFNTTVKCTMDFELSKSRVCSHKYLNKKWPRENPIISFGILQFFPFKLINLQLTYFKPYDCDWTFRSTHNMTDLIGLKYLGFIRTEPLISMFFRYCVSFIQSQSLKL